MLYRDKAFYSEIYVLYKFVINYYENNICINAACKTVQSLCERLFGRQKKQSKETKCGCSVEPAPVSQSTNYLILRYVQGVAYKEYAENKPHLGRQKK